MIQPFGDKEKGVEIIECDEQDIIQNKKGGKIPFREEGKVPRSWVEHERNHEKAEPGCYVNDDLYNSFL